MFFTRPCQYAIRALAHLASLEEGKLCRAQEVAVIQNIPGPFLATVFQSLVRAGLVKSSKGPHGGFCLARPPRQITLYDITEAVGSLPNLTKCAIGLEDCNGDMLCPLHDQWEPVRKRVIDYLKSVTLTDMAKALARKQRRQAKSFK
jgi:Rrf2 family protein